LDLSWKLLLDDCFFLTYFFKSILAESLLLSFDSGHGLLFDKDLFVKVLDIALHQLIVNDVILVNVIWIVWFKNYIQNLIN